ncbi:MULTISPECIES: hypothetical protein [Idiomarina]|jgi:hypothetical protein|uniref:hypothetical protein n=1 Tax=Idiomarina TaxID=135575 RepID=UPI000C434197|nr:MULTISPECIES: hypothetical protein [Idiomarina]MAO68419.1 hypothetical protein [Idiomarina sp.]MBF80737.1 hypothetical protein [Idiomarina sp.]|tara:strand:+ start:35017 stop:35433 length:417 start_codon:yes stop_codon:yes gene_type:complete
MIKDKAEEIAKYHELAKDAGNRLRAYILSVSSGATGVFFFALTKSDGSDLSVTDKWLLSVALISFVVTVCLCLYELRVDAKRFFALTTELKKSESEQNWDKNKQYKSNRYWLIHSSYVSLAMGILATSIYLVRTIFSV